MNLHFFEELLHVLTLGKTGIFCELLDFFPVFEDHCQQKDFLLFLKSFAFAQLLQAFDQNFVFALGVSQ